MRLKLIFLLTSFLLMVNVSAQIDATLVVPTADEYLSTIIELHLQSETSAERRDLGVLTQLEINYRYDVDSFSYTELRGLIFLQNQNLYQHNPFFDDIDGMHFAIVMAYIRENNIVLEALETLTFDEYVLNITPIDFSGDGILEYLIDMTWYEYSHRAYWIVQQSESGYQRITTPQIWFDEVCNFRQTCGGSASILNTDDINADGKAELILAVGGYCGYGFCGGHMTVLGWRDGEMVTLDKDALPPTLAWASGQYSGGGSSPIFPPEVNWTFENVDNDNALEIMQDWQFWDSHSCQVLRHEVYDWQEPNYVRIELSETYDDSLDCTLRASYQAMQDNRYEDAIEHYQRVIELADTDDNPEFREQVPQYAQIRIAIANTLLENVDVATEQIENLQQIETSVDELRWMLAATQTYLEHQNPLLMCRAVQDSLSGDNSISIYSLFDSYAGLDDLARTANYAGGRSSPQSSGCNAGGYMIYRLMQNNLSAGQSPIPDIEALGLTVTDFVAVDTNQDSVEDYLVWIEDFNNQNFLFLSDDEGYKISQHRLSLPPEFSEYQVVYSPDNLLLLVSIEYSDIENLCEADSTNSGSIDIRKVSGDGEPFYTHTSYILCEYLTVNDFDFASGELHIWSSDFEPQIVTWSETQHDYFGRSSTRQERIATNGVFSCGITGFFFCGFEEDNPELAIDYIEIYNDDPEMAISAEPSVYYPEITLAMEYRRALAYEQLGRIDEALATYQSLTESDTVWGQLAALHFQS